MDQEMINFLPKTEWSRREFVVTTLAVGFALSVMPVSAATITTPIDGLDTGETKIPTIDGLIPAYFAKPKDAKNAPIVLVVQEIFGVHEHIKDVCRRFAKAGYLAVAPELYARQGDVSKMTDIQEIIKTIVPKVPDAQVMSDLDATADWAAKSGGDGNKLAITGFCWGGRIVWLYSAHSSKVKAGVAWYGRLVASDNPIQPKSPLDIAGSLKAPVMGLYAGKDKGIPLESVEAMKKALQEAKSKSEIIVFADAEHGFHADYRPSYNEANAKEGWQKLLTWFKANGAA